MNIAYMTSRREPCIRWFFDSLHRELNGDYTTMNIIVVDLYADEPGRRDSFKAVSHAPLTHVAPKPNVWQGPHRLTKRDWFAAANARNTALCYCDATWIAYVDDLSVLMPGWWNSVQQAMDGGYVVFGAYEKVRQLQVENGVVTHAEHTNAGRDTRKPPGAKGAIGADGGWLYGCSLAAPVHSLLHINGWCEDCDGMGTEDYVTGLVLQRALNPQFRYDTRMVTWESEEGHHTEPSLRRTDKGVSPADKSHAILSRAISGPETFDNHMGPEGLAGLRKRILSGEPFPIPTEPTRDWYDGQLIAEMT